jgi:beta-N-acetylglucosaminidase
MTMEFVTNYISKKLNEDSECIRYTFYELRVKNNLNEEETNKFLELNKNYLENRGYNVFLTGDKFVHKNANRTVQPNELMIAVK